jgi:hypothetical protein
MTLPSTAWKEVIPPDEDARFLKHAEALSELQRRRAARGSKILRGLHAKPQLGLTAQLVIHDGLEPQLRQGIAKSPGRYDAYVRFSNGTGRPQADAKADVRGIAVKVLGVLGPKIIPGLQNALTQDFLAIRSSVTPVQTADEFVALVVAAEKPALLIPKLVAALGFRRAFSILSKVIASRKVPRLELAKVTYFSALPLQWGPYAAQCSFAPASQTADSQNPGMSFDYLADELAQRLKQGPLEYDFRVQFFVGEQHTPIEDASVDWNESGSPWHTIGRLTIGATDVQTNAHLKLNEFIDGLSFDPWHALVDHRPLGNMMRARSHAYRLSTQTRGASGEPTSFQTFAD